MRKEGGDYHGRGARPAPRGAAPGGGAAPGASPAPRGAAPGWQAPAIALAVAFGIALALRLAPLGARGDLLADSAFHLRMVDAVVADGHVPALDPLCEAPEGRRIAAQLPTGLYHATAWLHRALAPLDHRDARFHALLLTALAGALIVVPVFFAARALFAAPRAASIAALLAAVIPAHLHRTYALWLRYDALGSLLALGHVALVLHALAASGPRRRWTCAALAAVALLAAVACWRVPLVLPFLEVGFAILWAAWRGMTREVRETVTIVIGLSTLLFPVVPYLRTQPFDLSLGWLVALTATVAIWLPWLAPAPRRWPLRIALLGVAAVVAFGLARLFARPDPYAAAYALVPAKLAIAFGLTRAPTPIVRLELSIQELSSLSPLGLFGPGVLSWLAPWFVAAPFLIAWSAGGGLRHRIAALAPAPALFATLCFAMTLLTLLFERNKVLLGPLAAIACGALPIGFGERARARGASRAAIALLLGLCEVVVGYHAVMLAISRRPALPPAFREALEFLRERTPPGAIVMTAWEHGYEVQTYAARATVTDGLIESAENQRRLVAFADAAMAQAPDSLEALSLGHRAAWLLVPPSTHLYGVAVVAGAPFAARLLSGGHLKPVEADRALVQMMVFGREYPGLEKVFEREGYRVYHVTP